jgi:hypothetical protein
LPRVTRYTPEGMLFVHLEKDDVRLETSAYFRHVRVRPIQIPVPFTSMLPFFWRKVIAGVAERTPVIRDMGSLLLVRAGKPLRAPVEGVAPAGSKLVQALYHWYKNRRGLESSKISDRN